MNEIIEYREVPCIVLETYNHKSCDFKTYKKILYGEEIILVYSNDTIRWSLSYMNPRIGDVKFFEVFEIVLNEKGNKY